MTDPDFEIKLAKIEQKLDGIDEKVNKLSLTYDSLNGRLTDLVKDIAVTDARARSAHHRLDDIRSSIFWATGIAATIVGIFATVLTSVLSR